MRSNANASHIIKSDFSIAETVLDMREKIPLVLLHGNITGLDRRSMDAKVVRRFQHAALT